MNVDLLRASPSHRELSKHFHLLSDDLNSSLIRGIELQHSLSVQLWTETQRKKKRYISKNQESSQITIRAAAIEYISCQGGCSSCCSLDWILFKEPYWKMGNGKKMNQ